MRSSLLAKVQHEAAGRGLNLFGLVDAARYDACQPKERRMTWLSPKCGTVLVLGTGGRSFWERYASTAGCAGHNEEDAARFASDGVRAIATVLTAASIANRTLVARNPRLGLACLGEAAGFGTISPVSGHLLHPEFGPWIGVRAALLLDGHPFGPIADASITDRFQPCCTCSRPCISACPANVHDGEGHQDLARCGSHRHEGNCEAVCKSRSACPVGTEHRDGDAEFAHRHAQSLASLQRTYGLGFWRFVPAFLRRQF